MGIERSGTLAIVYIWAALFSPYIISFSGFFAEIAFLLQLCGVFAYLIIRRQVIMEVTHTVVLYVYAAVIRKFHRTHLLSCGHHSRINIVCSKTVYIHTETSI